MLPGGRAGIGGVQPLPPPLQPDLAEHRLGHGLAYAGDLVIEGVERQKRLAPAGRGEQRRLIPVAVGAASDDASPARSERGPGGCVSPGIRSSTAHR